MQAQADKLNEADTAQRLIKVFEDGLAFDTMTEISREFAIKDRFCDVPLMVEGAIRILVEAKSAGTVLRHKHIEQAQSYAANGATSAGCSSRMVWSGASITSRSKTASKQSWPSR